MLLWIYLAIGGVVFTGLLLDSRRNRLDQSSSELLDSLRGPRSRMDQLLEKVVVPVVAVFLSITGWPVLLGWIWREKRKSRLEVKQKQEAVFRIRPDHLVRQTTVQEAECLETVADPLRAVPAKPFGHLHHVWQNFLEQQPADAQLWVFGCDWESEWRCRFRREGYVWVAAGRPGHWMLTRDELLEDKND